MILMKVFWLSCLKTLTKTLMKGASATTELDKKLLGKRRGQKSGTKKISMYAIRCTWWMNLARVPPNNLAIQVIPLQRCQTRQRLQASWPIASELRCTSAIWRSCNALDTLRLHRFLSMHKTKLIAVIDHLHIRSRLGTMVHPDTCKFATAIANEH